MHPSTKLQSIWKTSNFETKLKKNMTDKNFEKINIKIIIVTQQCHDNSHLHQISVNLENFRFWDQICRKNMNEKNFKKYKYQNRNKHITMYPCTKFQLI